MHYVSVVNNIFASFASEEPGFPDSSLGFQPDEVPEFHYLSSNKSLFEICVNYGSGLRRFCAFADCPGTDFFRSGGKICLESEKIVSCSHERVETRFF